MHAPQHVQPARYLSMLISSMQIEYGQRFKIVGNQPQLGDWDVSKAIALKWHDGDLWAANVELPVGVDIEFKVCCLLVLWLTEQHPPLGKQAIPANVVCLSCMHSTPAPGRHSCLAEQPTAAL